MNKNLSGDSEVTARLRACVGRPVLGYPAGYIIKSARGSSGTVSGAGTTAQATVNHAGALTTGTHTNGTYIGGRNVFSPLGSSAVGTRIYRNDLYLGGVLRLIDERGADDRKGRITGGHVHSSTKTLTIAGVAQPIPMELNDRLTDLYEREWMGNSIGTASAGSDTYEVHTSGLGTVLRPAIGGLGDATVSALGTGFPITAGDALVVSSATPGQHFGVNPTATAVIVVDTTTGTTVPTFQLYAVGAGGATIMLSQTYEHLTTDRETVTLSGAVPETFGTVSSFYVKCDATIDRSSGHITVQAQNTITQCPDRTIILEGYDATYPVSFYIEDYYLGWEKDATLVSRNTEPVTMDFLMNGPSETAGYHD